MADCTVHAPLEIDCVESSRVDAHHVRLRLSGRWLDPAGTGEQELLVVQVEGRRHRFAGTRDSRPDDPERWSATFTLPVWAEPRQTGQATLWIGNSVIPVSPPGGGPHHSAPEPGLAPESEPRLAPEPEPGLAPASLLAPGSSAPEAPRSGPLADLLLKETVAALHAELEHRTADAARVRGALADARSELEARTAMQAALEATHAELRVELERLTTAVERRRAEFGARTAEAEREQAETGRRVAELEGALGERTAELTRLREQVAAQQGAADRRAAEAGRLREELAAVNVARDAAVSEVNGLRAELERLGTELAATRERVGAEGGDLCSAHRLLADARALADQLRRPEPDSY